MTTNTPDADLIACPRCGRSDSHDHDVLDLPDARVATGYLPGMIFGTGGNNLASPTPRRSRVEGCSSCDEDPQGLRVMPPHDASERCESGKRSHCSCGSCF